MAITWGNWASGGGNQERIGLEASFSPVTSASTYVDVTFTIYAQTQYPRGGSGDHQLFAYGGNFSGADWINIDGGAMVVKAYTTKTYRHTYLTGSYGTSPGNVQLKVSVSDVNLGGNPYVELTVPIPARVTEPPPAPEMVTASVLSDGWVQILWARSDTPTAPWDLIEIQSRQSTNGSTWTAWANAGTSPGSSISTSVATQLNRMYQFRIRAINSAGQSAWVTATPNIPTKPNAPSNVNSAWNTAGTQVTTTWALGNYSIPTTTIRIERSTAGGAWTSVATGLAGTTTTWTDTSPLTSGTNQYRVKVVVAPSGSPEAHSDWTEGPALTPPVPPLAPTNLSPNGIAVDFARPVTFAWRHNQGGDGSTQSAFTLETSSDSGSTWTVRANNISSTSSSWTMPAGTLTNGTNYLWRVRTVGITSAGAGANSVATPVTGSATPVVTIAVPGATYGAIPLSTTWTYAQSNGSPQAEWAAELYAGSSIGSQPPVEVRTGSGPTLTTTFTSVVQDGEAWTIRVRSRSAAGVWSDWVVRSTVIDIPLPAAVRATTAYDQCSGTVTLNLTQLAPLVDETSVSTVTVQRRVAGETEWVTMVDGLHLPNTYLDVIPLTNGINEYRIIAYSTAPSVRIMPIVTVMGTDGQGAYGEDGLWVFLSYGDAFLTTVRVHHDLSISESGGRARASHHFLGRRRPVLLVGVNTTRSVQVSGSLAWGAECSADPCDLDSPGQHWIKAAQEAEMVCYRDYTGRRFFGQLSDVTYDDTYHPNHGTVSFSVVETDFREVYAATAGNIV